MEGVLAKEAKEYAWAGRRNALMMVLSTAAMIICILGVLWSSLMTSKGERDAQNERQAGTIKKEYLAILDTKLKGRLEPEYPGLVPAEIKHLEKLRPVEVATYDLGSRLYPEILKKPVQAFMLIPVLKELLGSIDSLDAEKANLLQAIGAADEAALAVKLSTSQIVLIAMIFSAFALLISFFGNNALRCMIISGHYRALALQAELFGKNKKNADDLREALVAEISTVKKRVDLVAAFGKALRAISDFIKRPRPKG